MLWCTSLLIPNDLAGNHSRPAARAPLCCRTTVPSTSPLLMTCKLYWVFYYYKQCCHGYSRAYVILHFWQCIFGIDRSVWVWERLRQGEGKRAREKEIEKESARSYVLSWPNLRSDVPLLLPYSVGHTDQSWPVWVGAISGFRYQGVGLLGHHIRGCLPTTALLFFTPINWWIG